MTTLGSGDGAPDAPHLRVLAQYIKSFSFDNPLAAASARAHEVQPMIDMGVEVKSRPADAENVFEVDLRINVQAKRGEDLMFTADLVYAGLFEFQNVRPEDVEPLLWIECPRLLFPFAREIIASAVRDGGFPPLMLDPVDFVGLYRQNMERQAEQLRAEGKPS